MSISSYVDKTESRLKVLLVITIVTFWGIAVVDFHSRSIESESFEKISTALGEQQESSIMGHKQERACCERFLLLTSMLVLDTQTVVLVYWQGVHPP